MKRFVLAVAPAAALVMPILLPRAGRNALGAELALTFEAEGAGISGSPSVEWYPSSGTPHYFDLTFRETGAPFDEGLFTYDIGVHLVRPGGVTPAPGSPTVRLLTGPGAVTIPPDHFVMPPVASPTTLMIDESTDDHLSFSIQPGDPEDPAALGDINTGDKAGRIWYVVDPGTPPDTYRLQFLGPRGPGLTDETAFGTARPDIEVLLPVDISGQGQIITPEPSALSLLSAAALLTLRRRRG